VLGVLTVALAGAIAGITIWLVDEQDSRAAAAESAPAETAETATAETETAAGETAATTEAATTEAETEAATTETETEAEAETTTGGETTAAQGDAAAGEAIFAEQACGGCHTLAAAGGTGTIGPNLDDAQPSFELVVERVTNGAGAMPAFGQQGILDEQQIQDVAAYVVQSTQG
jgi:mono/diheme cytochrome c family protein